MPGLWLTRQAHVLCEKRGAKPKSVSRGPWFLVNRVVGKEVRGWWWAGGGHFPSLGPAGGQIPGAQGTVTILVLTKQCSEGNRGRRGGRLRGVGGLARGPAIGCGTEEVCFGQGIRQKAGHGTITITSSSLGPPERVRSPPARRTGTEPCLSGCPPKCSFHHKSQGMLCREHLRDTAGTSICFILFKKN